MTHMSLQIEINNRELKTFSYVSNDAVGITWKMYYILGALLKRNIGKGHEKLFKSNAKLAMKIRLINFNKEFTFFMKIFHNSSLLFEIVFEISFTVGRF